MGAKGGVLRAEKYERMLVRWVPESGSMCVRVQHDRTNWKNAVPVVVDDQRRDRASLVGAQFDPVDDLRCRFDWRRDVFNSGFLEALAMGIETGKVACDDGSPALQPSLRQRKTAHRMAEAAIRGRYRAQEQASRCIVEDVHA